jgi:biopolymer transport protein ExbD
MNFVQTQINKKSSNEDNLIPLINVVFLMLIFFMVAGVIRETDNVDMSHPASITTQALAKQELTLVVNKDESILIDDLLVTHEGLTSQLMQLRQATENIADVYLVLRVDSSLPAKRLHKVLKSIRDAGLLKVQLLTERLADQGGAV